MNRDERRILQGDWSAPFPLVVVQRLGYLLDRLYLANLTAPLARWVDKQASRLTPLQPGRPITGAPRDSRWRVAMNESLQMEPLPT